jgi:hypothetical protein
LLSNSVTQPTQWEEIMGHLILQGDSTTHYPGFSLLGESTLAITFDDALIDTVLDFLVLKGTTSVSIASNGFSGGFHVLHQLEEKDNVLTTVTVSGSEDFNIGSQANSNLGDGVVTDIAATAASPTKIHSSLTLIDASATTGHVDICRRHQHERCWSLRQWRKP